MITGSQRQILSHLSLAVNEMRKQRELGNRLDAETIQKISLFKNQIETILGEYNNIYDDYDYDYDYDMEDYRDYDVEEFSEPESNVT